MIACAAAQHFNLGHTSSLDLEVRSRMPIDQVMELYNRLSIDCASQLFQS